MWLLAKDFFLFELPDICSTYIITHYQAIARQDVEQLPSDALALISDEQVREDIFETPQKLF